MMVNNPARFDTQKKAIIASSEMLRVLNKEDTGDLTFEARIATANNKEVIWQQGADVNFVGLIGSGYVKMAHPAVKDHAYILDIFGPGEVFGLTSVVTGVNCVKSAVALTNTTFIKIPKWMIHKLYETNDQFKHQVVLRLSYRMRLGSELLDTLSNGHVNQKIAAVLLVLAKSYAVTDTDGLHIEVPLTRGLIATLAGTTPESAIRIISKWQKLGIVRTDSKHITILDEPALRNLLYE